MTSGKGRELLRTYDFTRRVTAFDFGSVNSPPVVSADNDQVIAGEGGVATNTGSYSDTDPGDSVTLSASVRDITQDGENTGNWSWSYSITNMPAQIQIVTITATDSAGESSATTFELVVNNVPAQIQNGVVSSPTEEDGTATLTGRIVDPGQDEMFTLGMNWGAPLSPGNEQTLSLGAQAIDEEGISWSPETREFSVIHQYLDDNPSNTPSDQYTITLTVSDTHTVTVDWGEVSDGSDSETFGADEPEPTQTGSFLRDHTYDAGGIYTVTVTVIDDHGATAETTTTEVITGVGVVDHVLYIIGTDGRDHVKLKLNQKKDELKVDAKLNQTGGSDGQSDHIKVTYVASTIDVTVHGVQGTPQAADHHGAKQPVARRGTNAH